LRADLANMPSELTASAHDAVRNAAESTEREMLANYPIGPTGHLRAGVDKDESEHPAAFAVTVRSRAPHAHLWEQGTADREMPSGKFVGRVVPHLSQSLTVVAERHRREMELELLDAVRSLGYFTVEGDFL
jgi:hypothetical protein